MGVPAWEDAAVLVPGRRRRPGVQPDAAAHVRQPHGATTVEIPSSHVAMVSHPGDVGPVLIKTAARSRAGYELDRRTRSQHDKCAAPGETSGETDISAAHRQGAHNE